MIDYKLYEFKKDGFTVTLEEVFDENLENDLYFLTDLNQYATHIDQLKKSYIHPEKNKRQNKAFNSIMACIERYDWYYLELGEESYDDLYEVSMKCIDIEYDD